MKNIITVYDNFFDDPNNVREEALKQDFYYCDQLSNTATIAVSYTHLRAHET